MINDFYLNAEAIAYYLVNKYQYTESDALETVARYDAAISAALDGTKNEEMAAYIASGGSPEYYVEYAADLNFFFNHPEIAKKIPDIGPRKVEYCFWCNYPKYIGEKCAFCNHDNRN
ncbi:hypothetical protein ACX93W_12465 [Paenibacillus sp. CAU 1782]